MKRCAPRVQPFAYVCKQPSTHQSPQRQHRLPSDHTQHMFEHASNVVGYNYCSGVPGQNSRTRILPCTQTNYTCVMWSRQTPGPCRRKPDATAAVLQNPSRRVRAIAQIPTSHAVVPTASSGTLCVQKRLVFTQLVSAAAVFKAHTKGAKYGLPQPVVQNWASATATPGL
jgi:hypothetical protein